MARIFLSYAREDVNRAEGIASSLEVAGHEAWWDRNIGAGESFSNEIDTALAGADLVVVLWSSHSIRSDWVRDEAAAGRDSDRLVPVLIDRVDPPLGFRQYQSVPLVGRTADHSPLLEAVGRKLGKGPAPARRKRPSPALPQRFILVVAIVALFGLLATSLWLTGPGGNANSIAILASNDDMQSHDLARSLAREIGRIGSGPLGQMSIIEDGGAARNAAYRIEVSQSASGQSTQGDVALKQRGKSEILWSSVIEVPTGRQSDLRQQMGAQVGNVLYCLAELGPEHARNGGEVLSLYLKGCAGEAVEENAEIFRNLTDLAPGFGPGWANLAFHFALSIQNHNSADTPGRAAQAKNALAKAKKLAPDLPETTAADALIKPSGGRMEARGLALVDDALKRHQDSPILHSSRSYFLQHLGRSRESIEESKAAHDLNPLSAALFDEWVSALAYGGRVEAAYAQLADAEKVWPGSSRLADARFRLDLRFGDPRQALAAIERNSMNYSQDTIDRVEVFLAARSNPTPGAVKKALDDLRAKHDRDNLNIHLYLQALVTFGQIDEAYAALRSPGSIDGLSGGTDILFRSYMTKFRNDLRFMPLAKRLGLVDAWRESGVWPDFCSEPTLPYDCMAEATKVRDIRDETEFARRGN